MPILTYTETHQVLACIAMYHALAAQAKIILTDLFLYVIKRLARIQGTESSGFCTF